MNGRINSINSIRDRQIKLLEKNLNSVSDLLVQISVRLKYVETQAENNHTEIEARFEKLQENFNETYRALNHIATGSIIPNPKFGGIELEISED